MKKRKGGNAHDLGSLLSRTRALVAENTVTEGASHLILHYFVCIVRVRAETLKETVLVTMS